MNYIMSHHRPELLPWDKEMGDDLLQGVPETTERDEDAPPRMEPDADRWPEHVGKHLGFEIANWFPVYWDGSGCHILHRSDYGEVNAELPARRFQYLALLDVSYEDSITVAIHNAAALLQFYRLVQPVLTLQADKRFGWVPSEEGMWQRGKSTLHFYENDVREYQKKHPGWRPGQPRPRKTEATE